MPTASPGLAAVLVQDGETAKAAAHSRACRRQVHAPPLVRPCQAPREPAAAPGALPLASTPHRQPFGPVEPLHPLPVHRPPFSAEQVDHGGSPSGVSGRPLPDPAAERFLRLPSSW